MYINQGTYIYGLQYGNGDIETGPFEVCVYLVNDDIESSGNWDYVDNKSVSEYFQDE